MKHGLILEFLLTSVEIILIYYLVVPIIKIIINDEEYFNSKIYSSLKNNAGKSFDDIVELIEKIVYSKLFIEHNSYQRVIDYVSGGEVDDNSLFILFQVLINRLKNKPINDKRLVEEIIKDIFKFRKPEELSPYTNNLKYVTFICDKLFYTNNDDFIEECFAQSFFLSSINNSNASEYKKYICNLIIRLSLSAINRNNVTFFYKLKSGILKSFRNFYPIELIYILDSFILNLIYCDNNVPKKLKDELANFRENSDKISWIQLIKNCGFQSKIDYDSLFKAYGISEIDLTYEPKYSKVVTCTFDKEFRFNYYILNRFNFDYDAFNFVVEELLKKVNYISNNRWIIDCLNDLYSDNDNSKQYLLFVNYNPTIYLHNLKGIADELSNINNMKLSDCKYDDNISNDVKQFMSSINSELENFELFERNDIDNKVIKSYNNTIHINSDSYHDNPNSVKDIIKYSMIKSLDDILMNFGEKNSMTKNDFLNKYSIKDILFADDWTIRSLYGDTEYVAKDLKFDILLYGKYIILKEFSIFICLKSINKCVIDENSVDDYIFEYRNENNMYYYNGKAFTYGGIKNYILNVNTVNVIKYQYIIAYASDKTKLVVKICD